MKTLSVNPYDPPFGGFDPAHLNSGQSVIQLLHDGAHLLHSVGELDLLAVVVDLADRGDDSCCSAESALLEIAVFHFREKNFSLHDLHAQIILSHIVDAAAGDGRKNAVGSGDDQSIVLINQKDVGGFCFFTSYSLENYFTITFTASSPTLTTYTPDAGTGLPTCLPAVL